MTSSGFSFDNNGNALAHPGLSFAYNVRNHTSSITPTGGSAIAMSYAGPGQAERKAAGTETFVSDLLGPASRTKSGTTTYFTRDPDGTVLGLRSGSTFHYFLLDGLNSVRALTGAGGGVVGSNFVYSYDPYGKPLNTPPTGYPYNPFMFANYHYDGVANAGDNLYKIGLRYYDPAVSRWTQRDAIDDLLNERGWNRYPYAADDPVAFVDPTGAVLGCPEGSAFAAPTCRASRSVHTAFTGDGAGCAYLHGESVSTRAAQDGHRRCWMCRLWHGGALRDPHAVSAT